MYTLYMCFLSIHKKELYSRHYKIKFMRYLDTLNDFGDLYNVLKSEIHFQKYFKTETINFMCILLR